MMKAFPVKLIFFLLLLTGSCCVRAQVRFSATISPAQISRDEYAQLKLSVENAKEVQNITPPRLKNFTIISGPNQESGMSMVNGDVKKYIAISYVIRPNGPGNFTIAPATAQADGATYQSNAVVLKVSNSISGKNTGGSNSFSPFTLTDPFEERVPESLYKDYILKKGENAADKIKNNMLVKVVTDKTSCFVGEPVIAEYKLYTRLKSESSMTKNPSFNGFSVIDLQQPDNMSYQREKLNGREYNVYSIRKAQLYPLQPGNLELEMAEVDNTVHFIKEEYARRQTDVFGDVFRDFTDAGIPAEGMEDHQVTLQSKPLSILVKPLPEAGKPDNFKGAVGNFSIAATIAKNNFTTDDAGVLTIIISGVGNLQLVTAPEIKWPAGIEGFEPKINDDLFKTTVPVSGRKIIEYSFTAAKPGTYTLPVAEFSFFDPKEGRYKTVATQPVEFTVSQGSGKPRRMELANDQPVQRSLLNEFFSNRLRVVSVVAILIILGLLSWLKYDSKKTKRAANVLPAEEKDPVAAEQEEKIMLSQQNPLAPAEESLQRNDGAVFYVILNQSLKNYLAAKFHIATEELNKKTITEQLDKAGINNDTCLQLHKLMDEIEWQLYTPTVATEQMQTVYERANELVQLLNTYKT